MKIFKRHKDLVCQAVKNSINRSIQRYIKATEENREGKKRLEKYFKKNDWLQWARMRRK
jgi:hypothetical protein